jgi:hypothetical protein
MTDQMTPSHPVVALMAGRYELVRELDARSDVRRWEAFDTALQRPVLLEFLPHEAMNDPDVVDRFWQSARTSARTSTAVGERVLDAGTDPETGRAFVVRERAQPQRLDSTRALPIRTPVRAPTRVAASRFPVFSLALAALGVVAVIALVVIRPGVQSWLAWVNEPLAQATKPFVLGPPNVGTPVPTAARATTPVAKATAAVAATSAPTAAATRTPTPTAGVTRRIVNTDGRGVALRASPGGDRLPGKGYDEGATVQAFESDGQWTRIKGSDGREGWVLSVTLG